MLTNHTYNLLLQFAQEHKSLWRINNQYKNDAGDCQECNDFWDNLKKDKEEHVTELHDLIKKHL